MAPPARSNANAQESSSSDKSRQLEAELEKARNDIKRLQNLVQEMTDDADGNADVRDQEKIVLGPGVKSGAGAKGKGKAVLRDDDTHYFDSYEHNGE
jgi:protein arginine N-methyltransferase 3